MKAVALLGALHTARHVWAPAALGLGLSALGVHSIPVLADAGIDLHSDARLWLQLPVLLVAIAGVAAALQGWPLMTRDRAGAGLVARLHPAAVDGCLPMAAGALLVLSLALPIVGIAFHGLLALSERDAGPVRAHVAFLAQGRPILGPEQPVLRLLANSDRSLSAVRISPLAVHAGQGDAAAAEIAVRADGRPLHEGTLRIEGSGAGLHLQFADTTVKELEIEGSGDGLWLLWPEGSVVGLGTGRYPAWLNAALAALTFGLPCALALLLAMLLRHSMSLAVAIPAAAGVLLVASRSEALPSARAIDAYGGQRWLPAESLGGPWAITICLVLGAIAIAARRRR